MAILGGFGAVLGRRYLSCPAPPHSLARTILVTEKDDRTIEDGRSKKDEAICFALPEGAVEQPDRTPRVGKFECWLVI